MVLPLCLLIRKSKRSGCALLQTNNITRFLLASGFAFALGIQAVAAQGEHARRVAAEIRVMAGDITRLENPDNSAQHKAGLIDRVIGGLAALDILLRQADQENKSPVSQYLSVVQELRNLVIAGKFSSAKEILLLLQNNFPLSIDKFIQIKVEDKDVGGNLHTELCAHCHDQPVLNTERPAYNLFSEAKRMPQEEFIARLLVGVRGDQVTGIDNPLSDYETAALVEFYKTGKK